MIKIYSGITRGRVLTGEHYAQIIEVNLSVFVCRLFHEDFSPVLGTNFRSDISDTVYYEIQM